MSVINSFNTRLFCSAEGTFNTIPNDIAAADALAFIAADFGPTQTARTSHRKDRTGTRSPSLGLVHGHKPPVEGSFSRSVAPGTTTTVDTHEVLTNLFGQLSTSTYTVTADPSDSLCFMLCDADGRFAEYLVGAVVRQRVITAAAEEPEESFTIDAARKASIAESTLNTDPSTGTTLVLDNGERYVNCHGAVILIESEQIQLSTDPSDFTYASGPSKVTITNCTRGVGGTSNVAHNAGTAVYPYVPTTTTAGTPIGENTVSMTFGGTAYKFRETTLTHVSGRTIREVERGDDYSTGIVNVPMEITAEFSGLMDTGSDSDLPGIGERNTTGALVLTMGTTTGSIETITLAVCELKNVTNPLNERNPRDYSYTAIAYGSSGNDDIQSVMS